MSPLPLPRAEYARQLHALTTPTGWRAWPFLPLVRRCHGFPELGLRFDALGAAGLTGFSATVFACLCGAPHKVRYADWRTMRTLLDAL